MIVAIHQPNYLPWLGYFHKITVADTFVFLDDVQFSKGSYTNRVKVLSPAGPRWITVPVRAAFGLGINEIHLAKTEWKCSHIETLRNYYRRAPAFGEVWSALPDLINDAPSSSISDLNCWLVEKISNQLGLVCDFRRSSTMDLLSKSDNRLVDIVLKVAKDGTYYSGHGASSYQDPRKFAEAELGFTYSSFEQKAYPQFNSAVHVTGLSVLDALFNIGWDATARMLKQATD